MELQKVWNPFNISSLIDLPTIERSPNYQREQENKKTRTCFSRAQVAVLEERFKTQKYITQTERCQLAEQLNMTDNQVKTWFQNRRTKWRRQESDHRFVPPPMEMEKLYESDRQHLS